MGFSISNVTFSNSSTTTAIYLIYLMPVKVLLAVFNITFNGVVIVIVLFFIKKKTFSNYLFMSNAVADFIIGILSIPFMTIFTTFTYWPLGHHLCIFWIINDFSVGSLSIYSLLLIAIHRYLQLMKPHKAKNNEGMNKKRYFIIASLWFSCYSFWLLSVIPITSSDKSTFKAEQCYFTYTFVYVLSANLVGYFLPIMAVFVVNSLIFFKIRQKVNNRKTSRPNLTLKFKQNVYCVDSIAAVELPPAEPTRKLTKAESAFPDGFKLRLSHKKHIYSSIRLNKEYRALICLCVVSITLFVLFAIFCVTWPLKAECQYCVTDTLLETGYWLAYLYSSINPAILLIFHSNFRIEFLKVLNKMKSCCIIRKF
jgi:hypothetical protein